MPTDLVLRGARVVFEDETRAADIAVEGDHIAGIFAAGSAPRARHELDCSGLTVLPGLIDVHSHHREPGFTHKEDIVTATRQCVAGGVTVSVAMPNVDPPPNTAAHLGEMLELYAAKSLVDYNVNAAATLPDEIPAMASLGVLAFKIFMVVDTGRSYPHMPGIGVHDHGELFEIFRSVEKTGLPLMVHPHDQSLMDRIEQEFWARGERDFRAYALAYSAHDGLIWDVAVATLLRIQQATGCELHLLHTATERTVQMVAEAKAAGRGVTAEVNPWAIWLGNDWETVERLGSYALSYYVPPHHAEAVYAGLRDGALDLIATDHAPHTREEKEPGWTDGWKAHTGTPSTQFYLSLLLTDVSEGKISLQRAVEITSRNPARRFGLYPRKGRIAAGSDADLVVVDLNQERTIEDADVLSKCGWTPYAGRRVRGVPIHTILRGQVVYSEGEVQGTEGYGRQAVPGTQRASR